MSPSTFFNPTVPIRLSLMARTVVAMAQVLPRSESGISRRILPCLTEVVTDGWSPAWRRTGQKRADKATDSKNVLSASIII